MVLRNDFTKELILKKITVDEKGMQNFPVGKELKRHYKKFLMKY